MTYVPTQNGFMQVQDSKKLLLAIFPNYPTLTPCHPVPNLEPVVRESADRSN